MALVRYWVIFAAFPTFSAVTLSRLWCYNKTRELTGVTYKFCRTFRVPTSTEPTLFAPRWRTDPKTTKQLRGMFPGLLLNRTRAEDMISTMEKGRPKLGRFGGGRFAAHDGDLHCPTYRRFERAPDSMKNVYNQIKDIVHFHSEDVYQYVDKGVCGSVSQQCGGGSCVQEKSIAYLMVWTDDPNWPTTFDPFELESYCSCKGVTF